MDAQVGERILRIQLLNSSFDTDMVSIDQSLIAAATSMSSEKIISGLLKRIDINELPRMKVKSTAWQR